MSYVQAAHSSAGCIFCDMLAASDDRKNLILCRRPLAFLVLNAYPYASGHLMAVVRRHAGALEELTPEELAAMMALVQDGLRALTAVYRPHGFNIGVNQGRVAGAGVDGHLHVHVVPRWDGDTNFMPVVGGTKVLPESLETTFARLSPALSR
jgi:ATP adenylyltransferase